jgi:hypothetical protein
MRVEDALLDFITSNGQAIRARALGRKAGGGERRPPQSEIQSECALT